MQVPTHSFDPFTDAAKQISSLQLQLTEIPKIFSICFFAEKIIPTADDFYTHIKRASEMIGESNAQHSKECGGKDTR